MEDGPPPARPSTSLGHSIEAIRLDVAVAREEGAHELLETIGELNRSRLIPIIERLLDEFDRPGELIRIDRIAVDLGLIAAGDFGALEGRLEDALREALREAGYAAADAASIATGRKPEIAPTEPMNRLVSNSGLVLATPFLPQLFTRLDLMTRNDLGHLAWRSNAARGRAVHLVQWLVDERCDRPEPMLALNKLLCGHPPAEPLCAGIEPTDVELGICRALLEGMIANWPQLSGSSVAVLRETFLQREGRLTGADGAWKLEVEPKAPDVLLNSAPWSFSMIHHPWMEQPLTVDWR